MIEIRPEQMRVFAALDEAAFARRVAAWLREAQGGLVREISEEQLIERIRRQIATAASYGIHTEAAVVQFVEMGLVYGEDFHCASRYPALERILATQRDGVWKMQEVLAVVREGLRPEA